MTCAMTANLETCAARACCQPVEREVMHRRFDDATKTVAATLIGYCDHHFLKVVRARQDAAK